MKGERDPGQNLWHAILTDVQFWIPAVVLAMGVGLLVFIHNK